MKGKLGDIGGQMGEGCWPGDSADTYFQRESWEINLLGTLCRSAVAEIMLLNEQNLSPLRQET